MKTCKKIFLLVLALIVAMNINVSAADYATEPTLSSDEVTLKADATKAKVGDTVTITVSAKCANGVGGLDSVLTWDSSKLQFENQSNFQLSGFDTTTNEFKFSVLCDEEATEADLATLEFKILDTATVGDKLSIKFSKVAIVDNNYEDVNLEDKELIITVIDEEGEGTQTPGEGEGTQTPGEGEGTQKPGEGEGTQKPGEGEGTQTPGEGEGTQTPGEGEGTQTPGEGEGTQTPGEGEGTQTPGEDEGTQKPGEDEGTQKPTEDETEKKPNVDNTIANKPINNAGIEEYAFALILITAVVIALYIKNKEYSDIK